MTDTLADDCDSCDKCERPIGHAERYARLVEHAHEDSVVCMDCLGTYDDMLGQVSGDLVVRLIRAAGCTAETPDTDRGIMPFLVKGFTVEGPADDLEFVFRLRPTAKTEITWPPDKDE